MLLPHLICSYVSHVEHIIYLLSLKYHLALSQNQFSDQLHSRTTRIEQVIKNHKSTQNNQMSFNPSPKLEKTYFSQSSGKNHPQLTTPKYTNNNREKGHGKIEDWEMDDQRKAKCFYLKPINNVTLPHDI